MKKKILIGFGMLAFASLLTFNVSISTNSSGNFSYSLKQLMANACCAVETGDGIKWCRCDYYGYCLCDSGWSNGRIY